MFLNSYKFKGKMRESNNRNKMFELIYMQDCTEIMSDDLYNQ